MRGVKFFGFTVAVFVALFFAGSLSVSAQQSGGAETPPLNLTISPSPMMLTAKPGQSLKTDIRIKNNGPTEEKLTVTLLKFKADGDTGSPQLMDPGPRDEYFKWVTFSKSEFVAESKIWTNTTMTINVPKSAAFGYYFAAVISRSDNGAPAKGNSGVRGGIATMVLLNVDAPGATRTSEIVEFSADREMYEFLPATFNIKLKNSGNVHVAPVGNIFIKKGDEAIATLAFNSANGNILPESSRTFTTGWEEGFPAYELVASGNGTSRSLQWNFDQMENLRFGKYTARLVTVYDDGKQDVPLESVVEFWVVPWRILAVGLVLALLMLAGLWLVIRTIWRIAKGSGHRKEYSRKHQVNTANNNPEESRSRPQYNNNKPVAHESQQSIQLEQDRRQTDPGTAPNLVVSQPTPHTPLSPVSHDVTQIPSAPPLPRTTRTTTTRSYRPAMHPEHRHDVRRTAKPHNQKGDKK